MDILNVPQQLRDAVRHYDEMVADNLLTVAEAKRFILATKKTYLQRLQGIGMDGTSSGSSSVNKIKWKHIKWVEQKRVRCEVDDEWSTFAKEKLLPNVLHGKKVVWINDKASSHATQRNGEGELVAVIKRFMTKSVSPAVRFKIKRMLKGSRCLTLM